MQQDDGCSSSDGSSSWGEGGEESEGSEESEEGDAISRFVPDGVDDDSDCDADAPPQQQLHHQQQQQEGRWTLSTSVASTTPPPSASSVQQRPSVTRSDLRSAVAANQPRVIDAHKSATEDLASRLLADHLGVVEAGQPLTAFLDAQEGLVPALVDLLQHACGGSAGFVGKGGGLGSSYLSVPQNAVSLARQAGLPCSPILDCLLGGVEQVVQAVGGELQSTWRCNIYPPGMALPPHWHQAQGNMGRQAAWKGEDGAIMATLVLKVCTPGHTAPYQLSQSRGGELCRLELAAGWMLVSDEVAEGTAPLPWIKWDLVGDAANARLTDFHVLHGVPMGVSVTRVQQQQQQQQQILLLG
jgi:hypothetical protein